MPETLPGNFVPSPARGRVLVFDSGVGGLTVAEEIRALGPALGVHYAADSGFFPYPPYPGIENKHPPTGGRRNKIAGQ